MRKDYLHTVQGVKDLVTSIRKTAEVDAAQTEVELAEKK